MVGATLSHYKILEKLGEGGMGVVWKALDTNLDREVAVKMLPEGFSSDPDRVARFEREAKLLASLNHRNIAAIFGVDQADGNRFLVMELVEGEDLACRLGRGPLPVEEAIDICHQLARALEAAHEKGVLHRDLKPANVQITHEGRVKVLDFGLAKAFESGGDPGASPTLTSAGTQAGVILGTAGYMSPEQARGKQLDKRTDIWSFGCVLFECLTGRPAFRGDTISDTLASILKSDANWSLLPDHTPPRVRELLQRCFEKDARNRLRDIGDARLELQRSITAHESLTDSSGALAVGTEAVGPARRLPLALLAATLVAGVAIGAVLWAFVGGTDEVDEVGFKSLARLSIAIPDEHVMWAAVASPSGRAVVYSATPRHPEDPDRATSALYVRNLDATGPVLIQGSDGVTNYTFSPDGRSVAARLPVAPKSTRYRLVKLRVDSSSPPTTLMELPDTWNGPLAWLQDGDMLMLQVEPLAVIRVPSDGGRPSEPIEIVSDGYEGFFVPDWVRAAVLPDGRHVLGNIQVFGERWDNHVGLLDLETGHARIVVDNASNGRWSPTGHLLFTRGDTLMAMPLDPRTLEPTGAQIAISDGLRTSTIYDAGFDIFPDGTLLHLPGGTVGTDRRIVTIDDATMEVGAPWSDDRRVFEGGISASSDAAHLAVSVINAEGYYEIWTSEVDRPRLRRLVSESGFDCTPSVWHPDGARLSYHCGSTASRAWYLRSADGSGEAQKLTEVTTLNEFYALNSFTPDGASVVLTHWLDNEPNMVLLSLSEKDAKPTRLIDDARAGGISPDGQWLLYVSDASGQEDIYIRRFDAAGNLGAEVPVTRNGCGWAWWHSRPGETPLVMRLIYGNRLHEIEVTVGEHVRLSEPRFLADIAELLRTVQHGFWDLGDGRFLAVVQGDNEEQPRELTVVVNWREELERRLRAER